MGLFKLILGVASELTLHIINKNSKIPKVFLEKGLKLWSCNWSDVFVAVLMLGLSEVDDITEKCYGKRGKIHFGGA